MQSADLISKALELPPEDRADLAYLLMDSLEDQTVDPSYEQAWSEEITRRLDAYRAGEATAKPAREALAEIRKRLNGRR